MQTHRLPINAIPLLYWSSCPSLLIFSCQGVTSLVLESHIHGTKAKDANLWKLALRKAASFISMAILNHFKCSSIKDNKTTVKHISDVQPRLANLITCLFSPLLNYSEKKKQLWMSEKKSSRKYPFLMQHQEKQQPVKDHPTEQKTT